MATDNDLIVLTQRDYETLRHDLKETGLDLCYTAQTGRPVRLDWSQTLISDAKFLAQVAERRPSDLSYRIASVVHTKAGGWLRPDEFSVTFHSVGRLQEETLRQYLDQHQVHSSSQAPGEKQAGR